LAIAKWMGKMSTFGTHRLDWLTVSKRFPWNANYETVYRWLASFLEQPQHYVAKHSPLAEGEALKVIFQVAKGLEFLHNRG